MQSRDPFGSLGTSWVDNFGVWLSQRQLKRIKTMGRNVVLDVGAGFHASNLRVFEEKFKCLIALDFSLSPEVKSKKNYRAYEFDLETEREQLSEVDIDLVLMISVLEHLKADQDALSWAHSKMATGGKLIVNVPTWTGKRFLEYSAFKLGLSPKEEMDDHKRYYSKKDLWPKLVGAGFLPSDINMRYIKFGLNLIAECKKSNTYEIEK